MEGHGAHRRQVHARVLGAAPARRAAARRSGDRADRDEDIRDEREGRAGRHAGGAHLERARLFVHVIEAQEDERLRISRELHDGPTQAFTNLMLRAEICSRLIDRDVVAFTRLGAQAVRAVRDHDLPDAQTFYRSGVPE